MTVPGVGPVVALTYRASVDQPHRFVHSRAVGAHAGLTPKRHQSGEIDYDGGVSKCGDTMLRAMLYEAAQSMLTHSKKWSWLKAWGMRVAQRRGHAARHRRGRQAARRHPAPHVGRRHRLPLEQRFHCRGPGGLTARHREAAVRSAGIRRIYSAPSHSLRSGRNVPEGFPQALSLTPPVRQAVVCSRDVTESENDRKEIDPGIRSPFQRPADPLPPPSRLKRAY